MMFNDATNLQGLVQSYEAKTNLGYGTVSGNTTLLREFTRFANDANRVINSWIKEVSGSWQEDDANHANLPIETDDLILGQRDYAIPQETLSIRRIQIKNSNGDWHDVYPTLKDIRDDENIENGEPMTYMIIGRTIRFNVAPSYNSSEGLKFTSERDVYDFQYTDTTATPGFASQFHKAIAVGAAIEYFIDQQPTSPTLQELKIEWADFERRIRKFYEKRHKDFKPVLRRLFERWK